MLEDEFISPYEHILTEIASKVMVASDKILTDNYGLGDLKLSEDDQDLHIEKLVE